MSSLWLSGKFLSRARNILFGGAELTREDELDALTLEYPEDPEICGLMEQLVWET